MPEERLSKAVKTAADLVQSFIRASVLVDAAERHTPDEGQETT